MGILVKIYQAGLLSEDMFLKVKTDVSKRYKVYTNMGFQGTYFYDIMSLEHGLQTLYQNKKEETYV